MREKVLPLLAVCALLLPILGCLPAPKFDEMQWRQEIENSSTASLYAPHFRDGRFFNPWRAATNEGFLHYLRWHLCVADSNLSVQEGSPPVLIEGLEERIERLAADIDFVTWLGHSSFLLRIDGEYWLTDPILSKRALIPKRKTPPAISAWEISQLTTQPNVIITHNHYDHLDAPTIVALPDQSRFFVPLGLKGYMERMCKKNVAEMDWWESRSLDNGVELVCLPAQHWSLRFGQWRNTTLWASFLLITPKISLYFGGDSGYFVGYREIGRRYKPVDFAFLPVAAYLPRWFMHYAHMDVKEALDAFQDLGAGYFVPIHWGTFRLGHEPIGYPALELRQLASERGLDFSRIVVMNLGEIVEIQNRKPVRPAS